MTLPNRRYKIGNVEFNFKMDAKAIKSLKEAKSSNGRRSALEVMHLSPAERQAEAYAEAQALAVTPDKSGNLVDVHFDLQRGIAAAHKAKERQLAATLGRHWLARMGPILAALVAEFSQDGGDGSLPIIYVLTHHVAALTELGAFDEAEAALAAGIAAKVNDGTKGGLAARVEKIRKRRASG